MTTSISIDGFSDAVGRIYDCALDPAGWEPTLAALMRLIDCKSGQLFLNDLKQHRILIQTHLGVEPPWLDLQPRYASDIHGRMEQWLDDGVSMDEPLLLMRHVPREVIAHSRYIQEWHRPQGFVDGALITLMRAPTRWSGLAFRRHESVGPFGEREPEILRLIIPHVRRSVTISNLLNARAVETARLSETLDALKIGIVLADAESRILHANRAAEELIRGGGLIRDRGGRLRVDGAAASAEINKAIGLAARDKAAVGKAGIAVRLTDAASDVERPVVAHVLPLAGGEIRSRLDPTAVAAVFINSPLEEASCADTMAQTFKLTPAEARVLVPVLSGKTVVEAAEDIGVAMTTARTHLNNIFAKTGVSRQSELIKLAASVAPAAV